MTSKRTYLLKIICFCAAATVSGVLGQQDIRATLYEQFGNSGMSLSISSWAQDLSTLGFDERARSACVVGMWIFYGSVYYNFGTTHWAASYTDTPHCFDFGSVAADVSSLRYVGCRNGLSVQTFNLYQYTSFTGLDESFQRERASLTFADGHQSIILTGGGNWTVFERINYSRPRACLVSTGFGVMMIDDIKDVGLAHNSLRSTVIHKPACVDTHVRDLEFYIFFGALNLFLNRAIECGLSYGENVGSKFLTVWPL